jgi:hypothetical protein
MMTSLKLNEMLNPWWFRKFQHQNADAALLSLPEHMEEPEIIAFSKT